MPAHLSTQKWQKQRFNPETQSTPKRKPGVLIPGFFDSGRKPMFRGRVVRLISNGYDKAGSPRQDNTAEEIMQKCSALVEDFV